LFEVQDSLHWTESFISVNDLLKSAS